MITNHDFQMVGKKTCSFGVAQLRKDETIDSLLIRSDQATALKIRAAIGS